MRRLLVRSGKSPLHVASTAEYLHQDLMGTNVGNLLFSDAAHRLLSTPGTEVVSNGIRTDPSPDRAARINAEYDAFVVPLANAFRPTFHASLDRLSRLIEQLTIPVVVLGVGAQAGADYDVSELRPLDSSVRRFADAVLDRSASIGVRGEFTAHYLRTLGYRDVEIIGCPSMFTYGDRLPDLRCPELPFRKTSRIAINLSPDAIPVGDIARIAARAQERFSNTTYFAQNSADADVLFWGDTSAEAGRTDSFPFLRSHELFRRDHVVVPLDPTTWIKELTAYDFAYGTRIHGNIAALLAGTPSVVLAHDSRTLELCEYFELPYRMLAGLPTDIDVEELYESADFTGMFRGHRERFSRLVSFLDRNGLENCYDHGDSGLEFDTRLAELEFPAVLRRWDGGDDGALRYRISRLRELNEQTNRRMNALAEKSRRQGAELSAAKKREADLAGEVSNLASNLDVTRRQLRALESHLATLERRLLVRIGPAIRRRIRRSTAP